MSLVSVPKARVSKADLNLEGSTLPRRVRLSLFCIQFRWIRGITNMWLAASKGFHLVSWRTSSITRARLTGHKNNSAVYVTGLRSRKWNSDETSREPQENGRKQKHARTNKPTAPVNTGGRAPDSLSEKANHWREWITEENWSQRGWFCLRRTPLGGIKRLV